MKSGRKEFLGERSNGAIRKSFTVAVARQYSGIRPIAPGIRRTTSQRNRQQALSGRRRSLHPDKDFILLLHEVYSEKTVEAMLSVSDFSIWEHLDLGVARAGARPLATFRERITSALKWPGDLSPSE